MVPEEGEMNMSGGGLLFSDESPFPLPLADRHTLKLRGTLYSRVDCFGGGNIMVLA